MLKISAFASEQYLLIYPIGDLIKKNKKVYQSEVNDLINTLKIKNIIIKPDYLNRVDDTLLLEILKTYNLAQKH